MLMDHSDVVFISVLRRTNHDFLPVDENFTAVGEVYARNHIHKGGFTASVFAKKRQNFTAPDVHADVIVRNDRAEPFSNVSEFDNVVLSHITLQILAFSRR